jgi:cysteinyl-tRNA synthetase
VEKDKEDFSAALDDDLNTPKALAVIFQFVRQGGKLLKENLLGNPAETKMALEGFARVFGLLLEKNEIPEEIKNLAEDRKKAREAKDFKTSDELRRKIEKLGYAIEDNQKNNYTLKKIS